MLEVRNLQKTYRPKHGVPVRAIDDISLALPERGMVFLLGKSGSGKSTLLNLLGGLDRYDGGDILVYGKSTKDFHQVHFDSYRNTYVGFIFQEYNLLDEFSVGANIALAIELQGRRAEDAEINEILREVDLVGYGNRRTNELSGGQKQRVAIARALVKKPKIIMADEPSGALDEKTGRAVFETLKKLSAERLVVVVSHDREFAESYGDRIIELADGRVIDDRTLLDEERADAPALTYTEEGVEIPADYQLTEEDRLAINEYLRARRGGKLLVQNADLRRFVPTENGGKTKAEENFDAPASEKEGFHLIKSRLPLRSAFRIGTSALAYKKVRLVFTILLSVVAFVLFGLSDTVASYNYVRTATNSIMDTEVRYAAFAKTVKRSDYYQGGFKMTQEELDEVRRDTGLPLVPVYDAQEHLSLYGAYDAEATKELGFNLRVDQFTNFAEITEDSMRQMKYDLLAGRIPNGQKDEIAISDFVLETFLVGGYRAPGVEENVFEKIESASDMLGKTLVLGDYTYEIVGVYDTHFDFDRYDLLRGDFDDIPAEDILAYYLMISEFTYEINYGLAAVAFTGEGFLDRYMEKNPHRPSLRSGLWFGGKGYEESTVIVEPYFDTVTAYSKALPQDTVFFEAGKSTLEKGEVVVPLSAISIWNNEISYAYTPEEIIAYLQQDPTITALYWEEDGKLPSERDFRIVGYVPIPDGELTEAEKRDSRLLYCADEDLAFFAEDYGLYAYALAPMPESRAAVERLVRYGVREDGDYRFELQNNVCFELSAVGEVFTILGDVFLWIGVFFAAFAAILFSNFIATSVAYKKQEIGILRAIGSRANDVFRIFFSEAFVIACISFVLSTFGTGLLCVIINYAFRDGTGLLISVMSFGLRQILLIFAISVGVAFLASFLPVRRIAAKRPIDAIRDR